MESAPSQFGIAGRSAQSQPLPLGHDVCSTAAIKRGNTQERRTLWLFVGIAYLRRSRILSRPARAQLSSSLAPGAPLAPIAPIVSSPSLITTPPPNNITLASFATGAIGSSPL